MIKVSSLRSSMYTITEARHLYLHDFALHCFHRIGQLACVQVFLKWTASVLHSVAYNARLLTLMALSMMCTALSTVYFLDLLKITRQVVKINSYATPTKISELLLKSVIVYYATPTTLGDAFTIKVSDLITLMAKPYIFLNLFLMPPWALSLTPGIVSAIISMPAVCPTAIFPFRSNTGVHLCFTGK